MVVKHESNGGDSTIHVKLLHARIHTLACLAGSERPPTWNFEGSHPRETVDLFGTTSAW
jgi:hypothetical protein